MSYAPGSNHFPDHLMLGSPCTCGRINLWEVVTRRLTSSNPVGMVYHKIPLVCIYIHIWYKGDLCGGEVAYIYICIYIPWDTKLRLLVWFLEANTQYQAHPG